MILNAEIIGYGTRGSKLYTIAVDFDGQFWSNVIAIDGIILF